MLEQLLAEIEARANAATGGKWVEGADGDNLATYGQGDSMVIADFVPRKKDRTFIAAARSDIPALIAALRVARAFVEKHADDEPYSVRVCREAMEAALKGERGEVQP